MDWPDDIPSSIQLTARAVKDLEHLLKKDRKNFQHVWQDLKRLGSGTLPQQPKKLKGFVPPIWQVDSGDFRIFLTYSEEKIWIRGVLSKPDQKKRFKGMH